MKTMNNFVMGIGLSGLLLFTACKKEIDAPAASDQQVLSLTEAGRGNESQVNVFKGPVVQIGDGRARSWIRMTHAGIPEEIGIEMTDGALTGLPMDPEDFAASTFVLPLHQKARAATPFDHIVINWNVHGHEPVNIFDVPHFDFHFYTISLADQLAIPPYQIAPAAHDLLPAPATWPAQYVPTAGGIPQMGKHWANTSFAPPFSSTMIYGSYNGKFIFVEPMITLNMLEAGTDFSQAYSLPSVVDPAGTYYPSRYNVYDDPATGNHYVTLTNFIWRD